MLDAPIRRIIASPLDPLAEGLAQLRVNANMVTVFGFALGLVAAGLIAIEGFLPAILFLALNRIADVLDGMVARRTRSTTLGAFLDASLDLFVYAAIPFAFALAHQQDALAAAFLLMALMVGAIPGFAARSLRESSSRLSLSRPFILCGHSETFIAFAFMCATPRWMFSLVAYFYGMLCFLSGGVGMASAIAIYRTAQSKS